MANRFRRFTSHGSGIASAALIVAAMSVHQQGPVAGAQVGLQQNPPTAHAVAQAGSVRAGSPMLTKVDLNVNPSDYHYWPH